MKVKNKPMKKDLLTVDQFNLLPFGSMVCIHWIEPPIEDVKNIRVFGIIFGDKIGYGDGSFDRRNKISEAMIANQCVVYFL